jgi:O-antigen ligase
MARLRVITRGLVTVASVEPILVAVIAPALLFPGDLTPLALGIVPALWIVRLGARGQPTLPTPFDGAVAVLVLMSILALLPSFDLRYSLPKVCGILFGVSLFYALANARPVDVWQRRLALALVVSSLAVALIGLLGTRWTASKVIDLSGQLGSLPSIAEWLPRSALPQPLAGIHPNEVGGTLAMLLPPLVALGLVGGPAWGLVARAGATAAALVTVAVLFLTQSRSAWFGVLTVLLVYVVVRSGRAARLITLLVLPALVVAACVRVPSLLGLIDSATGSTGTAFTRLEMWRATAELVGEHPVVGVGLNTFPFVLHVLYGAPDVHNAHAHNIYFQAAVDVGIPGAVALALLFLVAAQLAGSAATRAVPVPGLAPGSGLGLLAFGAFGLTDAISLGAKPGLFFWALLGALAIQAECRVPNSSRLQRVVSGPAPIGAALALLFATLLVAPEHARGWVASGRPHPDDWRRVATYLMETTRPSDLILVEALPAEDGAQLGAAYRGQADLRPIPATRSAFLEILHGRERVWLVQTLAAASDPATYALRWSLPSSSRLVDRRRFPDARIGVYAYELPRQSAAAPPVGRSPAALEAASTGQHDRYGADHDRDVEPE